MEHDRDYIFRHDPTVAAVALVCVIGLLVLFDRAYIVFDDWRFRRGMQFKPLSCEAPPAGNARYGIMATTGEHAPPRRYTILAIPATARHPDHYEADCRPRRLPGQGDAAPALTLGFDGRRVHGLSAPLPRLMPDATAIDRGQLLAIIRRAGDDETAPALRCAEAVCRLVRPLAPGEAIDDPLAGLVLDIRFDAGWRGQEAVIGDQLAGLVAGIATTAERPKPPRKRRVFQ